MSEIRNTPPVDLSLSVVQGEMSTRKRWRYRVLLVVAGAMIAAVVSLWVTEPEPLPTRLHVAFAAMTAVGVGWILVLTWLLVRRHGSTAVDRIATGWMATIACSVSLVLSVSIALIRGNNLAAVSLAILGLGLLGIAVLILRSGYSLRSRLLASLKELEKVSSLLLCMITGVALLVSSASAGFADEDLELTRTTFESRSGARVEAEFGRMSVPVLHAKPQGPMLNIAFLRVYGTNKNTPPLFVLAGGPGQSGIKVVKGMFSDAGKQIRNCTDGDIIGIDQRGVGESRPNLDVPGRYGFSMTEPGSNEEYSRIMAAAHSKFAQKLKDDGVNLAAFNTRENANDIDALRRALGYEKIRLWGTSYGSHLAFALIRQHGDHLDRVFVASPEGPDQTLKNPADVQKCLDRIARSDKAMWPTLAKTLKQLEAAPIRTTIIHPISKMPIEIGIGAFDIRLWVWHALGRTETTRAIAGAIKEMDQGNFSEPGLWLLRYRAMTGVGSAMKHAMDVTSGCSPDRLAQINEHMTTCLLGDVINFPDGKARTAWGIEELPDDFRSPIRSDVPILIYCGDLDPRTPLENAYEILKGFPNGKLLIVDGWGHGFQPAPSTMKTIGQFFKGSELPQVQHVGN